MIRMAYEFFTGFFELINRPFESANPRPAIMPDRHTLVVRQASDSTAQNGLHRYWYTMRISGGDLSRNLE